MREKEWKESISDLEAQVTMLNGKVDQMLNAIGTMSGVDTNDFVNIYKMIDNKLQATFGCSIQQLMNGEVKNNE